MNSLKIRNSKLKIPPERRLTIGIDASRAFVKDPAGPEYYSLNLIKALSKVDTKNKYVLYLRPGQKPNFKLPQNFEAKVIGLRYLWTQFSLAKEVILRKPDILFVPAHTLPLLASILSPQLPIVVTIHGLEGKYLPQTGWFLSHFYRNWAISSAIYHSDGLISVSKDTARDIVNTYKISAKRIKNIYEGVDLERFGYLKGQKAGIMAGLKQENIKIHPSVVNYRTRNILFVGTIQPRKNLVNLIEAFSKLKQKNTKLLIAGKLGWLYYEVLQAPLRFEVQDRVVFLGRIKDKALPGLYKGASVFVLPSLTEGFGLPILEAQASGIPVVASKAGAIPEVAGNGAYFIDPASADSIKEGLEKVLASNSLRCSLVKKGYKNVSQYSWEKTASSTFDYLQDMARKMV